MDVNQLATGEAALTSPVHEVVDLNSEKDEQESKIEDTLAHMKPVDATDDSSDHESEDDSSDAWESESLFNDAIEEFGDEHLLGGDPDACTLSEAVAFRHQLRTIGPRDFCRVTVECGAITAKKLLSAFGVKPPPFLEGQPDEAYYNILSLALGRELQKRVKLQDYNSIEDAVELLWKSKNIIVLTGAGISTSLGIPDFRSKDVGLYAKLAHLGLNDPQQVFDIELFREDPTIFYSVARDIIPSTDRFTPTHAFIHLLQKKGKLLTNYSQNIDNIEAKAGILPEKLIQCHGSFATASCIKCGYKVKGDVIVPDIKAGVLPRCQRCIQNLRTSEAPAAMKRKRSHNPPSSKQRQHHQQQRHASGGANFVNLPDGDDDDDDDAYDIPAAGVMKPDITFFGEALPDTFSSRLTGHDRARVDLVIVIGTSLKVAPVSEVVPYLPASIPQMYVSRTPVAHVNFDIDLLGDCDVVVAELCRRAGWDLCHPMIPEDQRVDVQLLEGFESRHSFTVRKEEEKVG